MIYIIKKKGKRYIRISIVKKIATKVTKKSTIIFLFKL